MVKTQYSTTDGKTRLVAFSIDINGLRLSGLTNVHIAMQTPQCKMMSEVFPELSAVRDAISKNQPFCTGTFPLTDNSGRLFFLGSDGTR